MNHLIDCVCLDCQGEPPRDLREKDQSARHTKRIQVLLTPSQYLAFLNHCGADSVSVAARKIILKQLGLAE